MKMKKNDIFKCIIPLLLIVVLASCKDSYPQPDFTKDPPIVELPVASLAGNGGGNSMSASFAIQTAPSDYYIYVNYAAANANPTDLVVTLAVDTAVLNKYNTVNGTGYLLLPSADYSLSNTITIPKGQRKVQYHIQFNTTLIDPTVKYALPLKIVSASGVTVSGNFGTLNLLVGIKNAYDADYTTTGFFFHPSAPRALKDTKHISTVGINTCSAGLADLYGSNYYFQFDVAGSNLTNWVPLGSTPAAPASGFMTADNPGGTDYSSSAPNNPGTAPWTSTSYNNTYDATAQTFYMHYGYNGTAPNSFSRQVYEKWVRVN